jgi:hypothetical protein
MAFIRRSSDGSVLHALRREDGGRAFGSGLGRGLPQRHACLEHFPVCRGHQQREQVSPRGRRRLWPLEYKVAGRAAWARDIQDIALLL